MRLQTGGRSSRAATNRKVRPCIFHQIGDATTCYDAWQSIAVRVDLRTYSVACALNRLALPSELLLLLLVKHLLLVLRLFVLWVPLRVGHL